MVVSLCIQQSVYLHTYTPATSHADNLTRVRLRPTGVKGADYINASFVDVSTKMSFSVTVLHLLHNSNGLIQRDCFDLLSDFPLTCRATSTGGHTSLHKVHWSPPWMISGEWCQRRRAEPLSCSVTLRKGRRWAGHGVGDLSKGNAADTRICAVCSLMFCILSVLLICCAVSASCTPVSWWRLRCMSSTPSSLASLCVQNRVQGRHVFRWEVETRRLCWEACGVTGAHNLWGRPLKKGHSSSWISICSFCELGSGLCCQLGLILLPCVGRVDSGVLSSTWGAKICTESWCNAEQTNHTHDNINTGSDHT